MVKIYPLRIHVEPVNPFRKKVYNLLMTKKFDQFSLMMILMNCVLLCLDSESNTPE
jgi:hypothetical protein